MPGGAVGEQSQSRKLPVIGLRWICFVNFETPRPRKGERIDRYTIVGSEGRRKDLYPIRFIESAPLRELIFRRRAY